MNQARINSELLIEDIDEIDFKLKINRLEKEVFPKEKEIKELEDELERLSSRPIRLEDDVLFLIESITKMLKKSENVLLDVRQVFCELDLWGIYELFSSLYYSLAGSVKILVDTCKQGVDRNLMAIAEIKTKSQNYSNARTTSCQQKHSSETEQIKIYDDRQSYKEAEADRVISQMYEQAMFDRNMLFNVTPSGINVKLEQMSGQFETLIDQSSMIMDETYARMVEENKNRGNIKLNDSNYVTKIFKAEFVDVLRKKVAIGVEKTLNKLYADFYQNERGNIVREIEKKKPIVCEQEQQTDIEGFTKIKGAIRDRNLHEKHKRQISDMQKRLSCMTEEYLRFGRTNQLQSIKISDQEKVITDLQSKIATMLVQEKRPRMSSKRSFQQIFPQKIENNSHVFREIKNDAKENQNKNQHSEILTTKPMNQVHRNNHVVVDRGRFRTKNSKYNSNSQSKEQVEAEKNDRSSKENSRSSVISKNAIFGLIDEKIRSNSRHRSSVISRKQNDRNSVRLSSSRSSLHEEMDFTINLSRSMEKRKSHFKKMAKNFSAVQKMNPIFEGDNERSKDKTKQEINQSQHQIYCESSKEIADMTCRNEIIKNNPGSEKQNRSPKDKKASKFHRVSLFRNEKVLQNKNVDQTRKYEKRQTEDGNQKQFKRSMINKHSPLGHNLFPDSSNGNRTSLPLGLPSKAPILSNPKVFRMRDSELTQISEGMQAKFTIKGNTKPRNNNKSSKRETRRLLTEGGRGQVHNRQIYNNMGVFQKINLDEKETMNKKYYQELSKFNCTNIAATNTNFNSTTSYLKRDTKQEKLISFIPIERCLDPQTKYSVFAMQIASFLKRQDGNLEDSLKKVAPLAAKILQGRVSIADYGKKRESQTKDQRRNYSIRSSKFGKSKV